MTQDRDGQAPSPSFNWQRNTEKAIESLLGICQGLIADNTLNNAEILFLEMWLRDNEDITDCWPGDVIAARVSGILADRVVTTEEAEDLKNTLVAIVGGSFFETGAAGGFATQLPADVIDAVTFDGSLFCLTGKFLYGPRKKCENAIISRGGRITNNITCHLNYLVVGTLSSRDWLYSSFGHKIQKAIENKRLGQALSIITEERWIEFL
jgi:NAD-dependent DNA ligase